MRARGFTLLEFAVCMSLCALLAGGLLVRLAQLQRESERASVQGTVGAMRTALAVRAAHLQGRGDRAGLQALHRENPFHWLGRVPGNYQGEYYRPRTGLVKDGHWYFDLSDQTVNFVQSRDTFSSKIPKLLRFKVKSLREPDPTSTGERSEGQQGITLAQLTGKPASTNH